MSTGGEMRSPTLPVDFIGDSKASRPRIARFRRDRRRERGFDDRKGVKKALEKCFFKESLCFSNLTPGRIFVTARLSLVTENSAPGSISPNPRARMDSEREKRPIDHTKAWVKNRT